jgi:hypothetical protein
LAGTITAARDLDIWNSYFTLDVVMNVFMVIFFLVSCCAGAYLCSKKGLADQEEMELEAQLQMQMQMQQMQNQM